MKRKTIVQGAGWGTSRFLGAVLLLVMFCSAIVVVWSAFLVALPVNNPSLVIAEFDESLWAILDRLPWWGWAALFAAAAIFFAGASVIGPILGGAVAGAGFGAMYNSARAAQSSCSVGGNDISTQCGRDLVGFLEKVFSKAMGKVYKKTKAMKAADQARNAGAGDSKNHGPGAISRGRSRAQKYQKNIDDN